MTNGNLRHHDQLHSGIASAHGMPGVAAVERLLESQHRLHVELRDLSLRQSALIEAEETDELLTVLGERERIIGGIQGINDSLSGVRARWSEFIAGLDPDQKSRIAERVTAITTLIEAVAQRDREDRELLRGKCDRVAGELSGLDRSRRAAAAYGPGKGGSSPLFQDREA